MYRKVFVCLICCREQFVSNHKRHLPPIRIPLLNRFLGQLCVDQLDHEFFSKMRQQSSDNFLCGNCSKIMERCYELHLEIESLKPQLKWELERLKVKFEYDCKENEFKLLETFRDEGHMCSALLDCRQKVYEICKKRTEWNVAFVPPPEESYIEQNFANSLNGGNVETVCAVDQPVYQELANASAEIIAEINARERCKTCDNHMVVYGERTSSQAQEQQEDVTECCFRSLENTAKGKDEASQSRSVQVKDIEDTSKSYRTMASQDLQGNKVLPGVSAQSETMLETAKNKEGFTRNHVGQINSDNHTALKTLKNKIPHEILCTDSSFPSQTFSGRTKFLPKHIAKRDGKTTVAQHKQKSNKMLVLERQYFQNGINAKQSQNAPTALSTRKYRLYNQGQKKLLFANKHNWHLNSPLDEGCYECKVCGKRFHQKYQISQHKKSHRGKKPFICLYMGCGNGFLSEWSLQQHFRLVHLKSSNTLDTSKKRKRAQE